MNVEYVFDQTDSRFYLAVILRYGSIYTEDSKYGVIPITHTNDPLQVLAMRHPAGKELDRHFHNRIPRKTEAPTPEVLFIRSGEVEVDIYNAARVLAATVTLKQGDVFYQFSGGHGFRMIEETEIVEVKLGPYAGDKDKTRF